MALQAFLIAGVPDQNMTLFHRVKFSAGDPAAFVLLEDQLQNIRERVFIVRDIEADRAREHAAADQVYAPKDLVDTHDLSADREVGTAQAIAALLRQNQLNSITLDRSCPAIYQHVIASLGIQCECDPNWESDARRRKSPEELNFLRNAQQVTEEVMRRACELVANAEVATDGFLMHDHLPLTSEKVQTLIDIWLLEKGYVESTSIVAGGVQGADCHARGTGPLLANSPVIIDIFPKSKASRYWGDCTRTVVNGSISVQLKQMHATVVAAKKAATDAVRAGVSGEEVNNATLDVIRAAGYGTSTFLPNDPMDHISMVHGTGHGVGLAIHEAPLLVPGGPQLLAGDVITIEPGLYCRTLGGVRVEDMVVVTDLGYENFNTLHEGLEWR